MDWTRPVGTLAVRPWMLRDIASASGGAGLRARRIRADLAFIGASEVADMGSVDDEDPRWDAPMAAFSALLTDRSPEATARIRGHLLRSMDHGDTHYADILVDPITDALCEAFGVSPAALVLLTRAHEDMVCDLVTEGAQDAPTAVVDIEDVEYEGMARPFLALSMEIADGVQLEPGRLEILSDIPETIGAVLAGRKVREFLSHPLLDGFDVRIRSWDGIALHLDHDGMAKGALE